MLKAIAQALLSYMMNIFKLPKRMCKKLSSIMLQFWWSGSGEKRGIH